MEGGLDVWKKFKLFNRAHPLDPVEAAAAHLTALGDTGAARSGGTAAGQTAVSRADCLRELSELTEGVLLSLVENNWEKLNESGRAVLRQVLAERRLTTGLLADLAGPERRKYALAAGVLAKLQETEAVPLLVNLLASSDLGAVLTAEEALKNYSPELTIEQLLAALNDARRWPPARIAEIIICYGQAAAPYLVKAFETAGSSGVRAHLIEILGQAGDPRGWMAVGAALVDPDPVLRQKGAWAAGRIASGCKRVGEESAEGLPAENLSAVAAAAALEPLLNDPVAAVRAEALQAVCLLSPGRTLILLARALLDPDWLVRNRAAAILNDRRSLPPPVWAAIRRTTLTQQDRETVNAWLAEAAD